MTHHEADVPEPFDMGKINAAVDAMTPEQHAEVMEVAHQVAAELAELGATDERTGPRNWYDIEPKDATDIELPRPDIRGPVDEEGEPCPWPWKPQQLVGAPMGQYHCEYCGAMVLAGVPHLDYSGKTWDRPEDHWINEDRFAQFRDAYGYARGHFSVAAEAFGKVDIVDAYRIWHSLQLGMENPWPG